eukprot:Cvel_24050.t1-p1 / transcript=Cvel_24050.t1 / gene=Cvel_24050 / organism=Chromera_velia_CCMP2878 / gene_product=hypothetical protein / transcript_product=hypothetical protein / location=Cvel_scaffold2557:25099-26579(+) / protein_length=392 / sequence_SO=supercontig / SO=protein_coding / is_pseudo=false
MQLPPETTSAMVHFVVNVIGVLCLLCIYYNYVILEAYFYALFWAVVVSIPLFHVKMTLIHLLGLSPQPEEHGEWSSFTDEYGDGLSDYLSDYDSEVSALSSETEAGFSDAVSSLPVGLKEKDTLRLTGTRGKVRRGTLDTPAEECRDEKFASWVYRKVTWVFMLIGGFLRPWMDFVSGVEPQRASEPFFGMLFRVIGCLLFYRFVWKTRLLFVLVLGLCAFAAFRVAKRVKTRLSVSFLATPSPKTSENAHAAVSLIRSAARQMKKLIASSAHSVLALVVMLAALLVCACVTGFFAFQVVQETAFLWDSFRTTALESSLYRDHLQGSLHGMLEQYVGTQQQQQQGGGGKYGPRGGMGPGPERGGGSEAGGLPVGIPLLSGSSVSDWLHEAAR